MARICHAVMFGLGLSIAAVGCGGPANEVNEDTRPPAEVQQELENYDKQMEESAKSATNS
ncbi:MAG: hypothetical protein ACO1RT_03025 [Planctomycetaceae bacterium]